MALAKKCDICGSLYENYNSKPDAVSTNGIMFLNIRDLGNYSENRKYDCCPECMDAIKHFVESLRKGEHTRIDRDMPRPFRALFKLKKEK